MTEENTRKTYILQKDTPDSKSGTKFINSQNHIPGVYMAEGDYRTHRIYLSETVENNQEWFLIEEEHLKKSNSSSTKNEIMTPETAREFAAEYKAKQMDRVMNRIIGASKFGKYRTEADEALSDNTISLLQSKGFKFNPRIAGDLYSVDTISWEEEPFK